MNIDDQIQRIDIEIEAVEHAIKKAMAVFEEKDLIKSVTLLQQQRNKLIRRQNKH